MLLVLLPDFELLCERCGNVTHADVTLGAESDFNS